MKAPNELIRIHLSNTRLEVSLCLTPTKGGRVWVPYNAQVSLEVVVKKLVDATRPYPKGTLLWGRVLLKHLLNSNHNLIEVVPLYVEAREAKKPMWRYKLCPELWVFTGFPTLEVSECIIDDVCVAIGIPINPV
jgi:hypothetical protein